MLRGDCTRIDTCVSRVRHFLPDQQYFTPGQARTCALVGNSANLMSNISFADEIDSHDLVIRVNDARTDVSSPFSKSLNYFRLYILFAI